MLSRVGLRGSHFSEVLVREPLPKCASILADRRYEAKASQLLSHNWASIECLYFSEEFYADGPIGVRSEVERGEPKGNLDGFCARLHHSKKRKARRRFGVAGRAPFRDPT